MKKILIIISFYGMIQIAQADVLDDAIKIVVDNSPSLQGNDVILGVAERKKVWTSKLQLGALYGQSDTIESTSGTDLRARLTFEVPLFDDGGKGKSVAEQKLQIAVEKDRVIGSFLQKVTTITMLERKTRIAEQDYQLAQTKYEYFKQAQEKGVVEGSQLWQQVEAVNTSQNAVFLSTQEYEANLTEVARQYGGVQYIELKALISQYAKKSQAQSTDTPATPSPVPVPEAPPVPVPPPPAQ
jgi:hypothetical protein